MLAMYNLTGKEYLSMILFLAAVFMAVGAGCNAGCGYLKRHLNIEVEWQ